MSNRRLLLGLSVPGNPFEAWGGEGDIVDCIEFLLYPSDTSDKRLKYGITLKLSESFTGTFNKLEFLELSNVPIWSYNDFTPNFYISTVISKSTGGRHYATGNFCVKLNRSGSNDISEIKFSCDNNKLKYYKKGSDKEYIADSGYHGATDPIHLIRLDPIVNTNDGVKFSASLNGAGNFDDDEMNISNSSSHNSFNGLEISLNIESDSDDDFNSLGGFYLPGFKLDDREIRICCFGDSINGPKPWKFGLLDTTNNRLIEFENINMEKLPYISFYKYYFYLQMHTYYGSNNLLIK